uniref:Uncharacterized protein n=1 Tax=viral metagenome TaxID=1070528 RepID=A0A6C0ARQ7_9ZZZZ
MENIIEPNDTFDFSKLSLAHPVGVQGGAYFTKIEFNKKPLYIQTSKIQTKQGFVKSGKKYYCDLMFDKNSEQLIHWFENLEEKCQKLIFEKKDTWFENSLEESDIESAFNSTIRIYKSGKFYLVRTNIKNSHNNLPCITIYNEQEAPLTIDDITSETNLISILEIQGIKFTSRNFQIEIELKQVMVLNNEPLFDNCLIKPNKRSIEEPFIPGIKNTIEHLEKDEPKEDILTENIFTPIDIDITSEQNLEDIKAGLEEFSLETSIIDDISENNNSEIDIITNTTSISSDIIEEKDEQNISLEFEDLNDNIEENNDDDLKEMDGFDLSLENLEKMQLKKPNQVYFELYKEARSKAKQAKKSAILAYLEAKNIKKTYMLENLNDSDSDFDAEIDEVSESELDGL